MNANLTGGCSCGAVRYRLTSDPMFVNCCHCLDCQRHTGSAFALNAIIETGHIVIESDEPVPVELTAGSGRPLDIYRCPKCQTSVWSDYGRRPGLRFVRVGTLDDPGAVKPDAHIFIRSKQPWVALPEDVPSFEDFYLKEMRELWPAGSIERFQAAVG